MSRHLTRLLLGSIAAAVMATGCAPGPSDPGHLGAGVPSAQRREPTSCHVDRLLVPSCGLLWGAAPAAFARQDPVTATERYEALTDSVMDVYHSYHRDDELFPTEREREVADGGVERRLLMTNWKPSTQHTWREVADGAVDARIDRLGQYIHDSFSEPFFFVIWHEPENDVDPAPGSGMTAVDYRDMYRHVADRLRAAGADNLVLVMNYQGYPKFTSEPWYHQLWPGDDYVDWIASDSYQSGGQGPFKAADFHAMVNRRHQGWPGFYDYWSRREPDKPLMLGEWGVFDPAGRAAFYDDVREHLEDYPRLKAMIYFNTEATPDGRGTKVDGDEAALESFRRLTDSVPRVDVGRP